MRLPAAWRVSFLNILSVSVTSVDRSSLQTALKLHLASWGLKQFTSDAEYFAWQQRVLSAAQLHRLHALVERKRRGGVIDEVAFYDAAADPPIFPALYSQRYEYYLTVGPRVALHLGDARTVLDVGCGVGILTTFYAAQWPDKTVVGIDRSPQSLARAEAMAKSLKLGNVRFELGDVEAEIRSGSYEAIIATHALVQAEQDPGIPSRDWTTFERARDPAPQRAFETRTGVGVKLDRLCALLDSDGRMIVCEKTRQVARRVPFQRALAARGLMLAQAPEPLRYCVVEEVVEDGPLYVLARETDRGVAWDESPEPDDAPLFERRRLHESAAGPDAPLYENHAPSAERAWKDLTGKQVIAETTRREPDGRQLHVELGTADGLAYLYCANTFDQRQLVIMAGTRGRTALKEYYDDIVAQAS